MVLVIGCVCVYVAGEYCGVDGGCQPQPVLSFMWQDGHMFG